MRYLCTNCNYIYDEWLWNSEDSINSWTRIYDIEDFVCPSCYEWVDNFQEIIEEINYIDESDDDDVSKDHTPITSIIEDRESIYWKVLQVFVWEQEHVMWDDHFIKSISLHYEDWEMIEEKFLDPWDDPLVEFDFDDLEEYEIRINCSLHWVWGMKIVNMDF